MPDISLFGALNTGLLGIYTSKLAMNVVSHNIANANTPGFSRQVPIIRTMPPIPATTLTQPSVPLQIGTGSKVKDIKRIRDQFLDIQYRQVNNKYNYWDSITSNLHFIEQLLAEPGDSGIRYLFDSMWSGMEEIITDPTNSAAKRELVSRAEEFVKNIKDLYFRLEQLREDLDYEISQRVEQINSMVKRLADINAKVRLSVALKSTPNDLLDERDRILDELSTLADIYYTEDASGQITLRIGDQIVLTGSDINKLRALERPYGKGFKEIFVSNSKVDIHDGSIKAALDLRDKIIVKYMNRLDEFVLYLTDKFNLTHRDGFNKDGSVTGLDFFSQIEADNIENSVLFRIAGSKRVEGGPINYISGMSNRNNVNDITTKQFIDQGSIVFFDGSLNTTAISVNSGDTIQDFMNYVSSAGLWFNFETALHNGSTYLLRMTSSSNLKNTLALDFNGNMFNTMGFDTKDVNIFVINQSEFNVQDGTYKIKIDGVEANITINSGYTLNDLANDLNANFSSSIRAFIHNNKLLILPTKSKEFDINRLEIQDTDGLLTQANLHIETYKALNTEKETLDNILNRTDPFKITIGATEIEIDPTQLTLKDFVAKLNEAGTGILFDITPHNKVVIRGTRSMNFKIDKTIKGPEELFVKLGFIDADSDPTNDWNENYIFLNPFDEPKTLRERFSKADTLFVDKIITNEPFRFVEKFKVNSTVSSNPETIAVDYGIISDNTNWDAKVFNPTGQANTTIMEYLSSMRFEKILNDGRESFAEYLGGIVAEMGVEGETAMKMKNNTDIVMKDISNERERVKGVSLDEEMANMIKFQHAFNASARVMTAVDEMIGRVIDKLGVVGR
ncbi:flagellar hook protein FlgK [Thermosipho melanesiensis]|uniref:Flagellar hook-associated protein 1 n=2 Tax=Thermosipho melanesiensis TaxID=46541 RepID=A6LJU7_THEM4|nr:flagellar hook-associated protein FlgK [Thermosipho melanesiensis]ABR30198.1 flagellar hook-associated protein FlgK [Thermosipho melanesiensis BI429]APT73396.1 flagellar hook protein FlgK [Thermosipho melanesiensis]OOC38210.1 flagellar hook protein FlgK [Thermosipho melanesiensis]OOC40039.1 flagellar hook protein FlgK [Thermosipho melanesiensis]OOC40059.1 flagellar hook protein FlgK [Thermosipho melanesiensis]